MAASYARRGSGPMEASPAGAKNGRTMFIFFSNKLGWVKSILLSIVLTLLLLALFGVL